MDPYTYARDHEGGPGAWCVIGPNGFKVAVQEKNCAFMLGKLLSGKTDEAAAMARDFVDPASMIDAAIRSASPTFRSER